MSSWVRNKLSAIALVLFIVVAFANFLTFSFPHDLGSKDASEYSAYGENLATQGLYSIDGTHFDTEREPGYPFFVAAVYKVFGNENFMAIYLLQTLLIGILGFIVYRVFAEYGERAIGFWAGLCVSALPLYGYYADNVLSEIVFTFLLGVLFYLGLRIMRTREHASWSLYALFGLVCGYETLVRVQMIFFIPLLIACYFLFLRPYPRHAVRNILLSCLVFCMVIGSWVLYVHRHTGYFTITDGRQELVLNIRAVRAQLSYSQLNLYLFDWLKRSVTGGESSSFLSDNEYEAINANYYVEASTSQAMARIKQQNIQILLSHPGQYLYGNLIEVVKIAYIDHDYSDSESRYLRPAVYALVYGLCLFGLYGLVRNWRERDMRLLILLAILFPLYNFFVLSFFDGLSRYNTPFLMFYIVIGFAGIVMMRRRQATQATQDTFYKK